MLKKFFIAMLGSMAGFWISLIVLVFIGLMAIGIIAVKASGSASLSDKNILYIDLSGSIPEREAEMSLSDIMSYSDMSTENLSTILQAIRKAADDSKIKGVLLDCGEASMGFASRAEMIQALAEFKKSGKWVYAYADNFSQGDYYVASVADSLFINPVGMLEVKGLASQNMFFKDVLDKLGIKVDVIRVGSFKSAVEPFMRMDMSPESRMQTEVFLSQIWDDMSSTIARNRSLSDAGVVSNWADSLMMTWDPERYVQVNAVNSLCYRTQLESKLRKLLSIDADKDLPYITPTDYMGLKADELLAKDKPHVAVLYAVGDIVTDGSGIASETMVPLIEQLKNDKKVKALVLRVNSPGGSAFASEQIWHALEDFKATGRPFYVSMGDYAASGGYYISCGADVIYADASTITGSIGIFGLVPNAQDLIEKKIGLGVENVMTSPNALFPDLMKASTPEQLAAMQEYVNRGYETFTSRVSMGRDISVDSVKVIGGGRVWDGISAKNIGLVDSIGTLQDAVAAATAKVGLTQKDVITYPEIEASVLNQLLRQSAKNIEADTDPLSSSNLRDLVEHLRMVTTIDPLQARMEYIIVK